MLQFLPFRFVFVVLVSKVQRDFGYFGCLFCGFAQVWPALRVRSDLLKTAALLVFRAGGQIVKHVAMGGLLYAFVEYMSH